MGTPRKGLPEFWPSGLAGILAGDNQCLLKVWLPGHETKLEKIPSTFDFATWRVQHTALCNDIVRKAKGDGWATTVEDQNRFRLKGSAAILCGKPDIVGRKGARVRVWDGKTGIPKDTDKLQVAIYMIALPMAWERPGLVIDGAVVYSDHTVHIEPETVEPIRPKLFALLRELGTPTRLPTTPSEKGCRYCDLVAADCPDRWTGEMEKTVAVAEF